MRACFYEIGYCPSTITHVLFMMQDDDSKLHRRVVGLTIHQARGMAAVW
jgi:hypothetical protein